MKSDIQLEKRTPSWGWSALPFSLALILLLLSVTWLKAPLFLSLLIGFGAAVAISYKHGHPIGHLLRAALRSVRLLFPVFFILLLVSGMISIWITSGTVSAMIYVGLDLLPPQLLLLTAFLMGTAISILLGTSIGTLSTVGVAFMSIASHLDISLGWMGGALLSGAFIGDRTSPLSSSVHLNAAMSGSSYREMLPELLRTLWPVTLILLVLYTWAGWGVPTEIEGVIAAKKQLILDLTGGIRWWMFVPPVVIILSALLRQSTKRTLFLGLVSGSIVALWCYDVPWNDWLQSLWLGASVPSLGGTASDLGAIGGWWNMGEQLLLILAGGTLYGVMDASGMMKALVGGLLNHLQSPRKLVGWTGAASVLSGAVGCNQAMSIMIPGQMLSSQYDQLGVPRAWLARNISDSGVVLSAFIPWNLHSILCSSALGITVLQFAPYAALLYLLPLASLVRNLTYEPDRKHLPRGVRLSNSNLD